LGNFIISFKDLHVEPFKEENLGFFKKMSYSDKLKEISEAHLIALALIKEVSEVEYEKFKMWGVYEGIVKTILNWPFFEAEDQFKNYSDNITHDYSFFNHPLPEFF
jgi:hypothetical protein